MAEDLQIKTDRELLLLTAQTVTHLHDQDVPEIKERLEKGDATLLDHEIRLTEIQTARKVERRFLGKNGKTKIVGGTSIVGIITAIIYGIGTAAGWW